MTTHDSHKLGTIIVTPVDCGGKTFEQCWEMTSKVVGHPQGCHLLQNQCREDQRAIIKK